MARKRIVVVGTSFAGFTGALELHELLGNDHDITVVASVTGFDLEQRLVKTDGDAIPYDYLLIATGPKVDFASVPGLGPHQNSWSICNIAHAEATRRAWERFLNDPGPIVIGASQGAACFGAAYEFIF